MSLSGMNCWDWQGAKPFQNARRSGANSVEVLPTNPPASQQRPSVRASRAQARGRILEMWGGWDAFSASARPIGPLD